jgi:hypothetical protein
MEARADIPPIITAAPRRTLAPAYCFGLVALAIAAALLSEYFEIAFPQCTFKTLTGFPCAFCGGTRALRAIGHLRFAEAFWFNPLVTIGAFAAAICAMAATIAPRRFDALIVRMKRLPLMAISLAIVAVNWVFVLKFLPR